MKELLQDPTLFPSDILKCDYGKTSKDDEKKKNDEFSEFSFETDHIALRGNSDYYALLKTLAILQAQRSQAISDMEALLLAQEEAAKDPLAIVQRLQNGEKWPNIPGNQVIAQLPDIDWEKYRVESVCNKPETRHGNSSCYSSFKNDNCRREILDGLGCKVEKLSDGQVLVRGRLFNDKKPKTFNQPWTAEEQKRLEELLIEFPSEDVEMERWKKIAVALGNRTPIQVQSRIQKYFLKLQKAGLPIPGRITKPKNRFYKAGTRSSGSQQKKNFGIFGKNSSFFPSLHPSLKMDEDEDFEHIESAVSFNDFTEEEPEEDISDDEEIPEENKGSEAYKELLWLKRIRREQEIELRDGTVRHGGFACDGCKVEPIVGSRWHCVDCRNEDVDFCNNCAPKQLSIGSTHNGSTHKLKPFRKKVAKLDRDYVFSTRKNYLDPNSTSSLF